MASLALTAQRVGVCLFMGDTAPLKPAVLPRHRDRWGRICLHSHSTLVRFLKSFDKQSAQVFNFTFIQLDLKKTHTHTLHFPHILTNGACLEQLGDRK